MKKKFLAFALLAVLLFSFTACNGTEISFYQTAKSAFGQKDFSFQGSLSLDIKNLQVDSSVISEFESMLSNSDTLPPADVSQDDVEAMIQTLKSLCADNRIVYDGSISQTDDKIVLNVGIQDSQKNTQYLLNLIIQGKVLYISKDAIMMFAPDGEYTYTQFDGVDYATFNIDDFVNQLADNAKVGVVTGPISMPYLTGDETQDYQDGYNAGYEIGLADGYANNEEQPTVDGTADYISGYSYGYEEAYYEGSSQKWYEDDTIASIEQMRAYGLANDDITKFLSGMSGVESKFMDEIVNNLFNGAELGIITKTGDSKYTLSLDNAKLENTMNTIWNVFANPDNVSSSIVNILNTLSDQELTLIGVNPSDKADLISAIQDGMLGYLTTSPSKAPADPISMNYTFNIEKTGSVAYKTDSVLSIKTTDDNSPVKLDADINSELLINDTTTGDNAIIGNVDQSKETNALIKFTVNDPNAVEYGIIYSTSPDFTNPITVKATKLADGSYGADIQGLSDSTKYYYKTYSKDAAGNIVYSSTVLNFSTTAATPDVNPNPTTADSFDPVMLFMIMGVSLMYLAFITIKKKGMAK